MTVPLGVPPITTPAGKFASVSVTVSTASMGAFPSVSLIAMFEKAEGVITMSASVSTVSNGVTVRSISPAGAMDRLTVPVAVSVSVNRMPVSVVTALMTKSTSPAKSTKGLSVTTPSGTVEAVVPVPGMVTTPPTGVCTTPSNRISTPATAGISNPITSWASGLLASSVSV